MELNTKTISIELDGEKHKLPYGQHQYGRGNATVVRGEPFREWFAKRGILQWGHSDRPTFDLMEVMVIDGPRLWRVVE